MKVVLYEGIVDPSLFKVVDVRSREDILGKNIVGIYPTDDATADQLVLDITYRIKSRVGRDSDD